MNFTRIGDFTIIDQQRSALFLLWQAREWLSEVERNDGDFHHRAVICGEAATLVAAAKTALIRPPTSDDRARLFRYYELCDRAVAAANAAKDNGLIATNYHTAAARRKNDEWEQRYAPKAGSIFKRAAETARSEVHRTLVELCEMCPDAMPEE